MTWSLKRQLIYTFILILFLAGSAFIILYPSFNKEPTCSDGQQNGTETGVDCGGSCANACLAEVNPMSVLWARSFQVIPGRYNAVAYVTNHNKDSAIRKINYRFRFADKDNLYIGKREGSTLVPPRGNFAIFEPAIDIGNSIPVYTTFEFTSAPNWLQVSAEKLNQLKLAIANIELVDEETSPRLSATLRNNSLFTIPEMRVIAILYDARDNAIATSQTFLTKLGPLESAEISFTWPEPLSAAVVAKEIIPIYDIFSVELK